MPCSTASATCSRGKFPLDAPDPKRGWIGIGSEATGSLTACCAAGWFLTRHFGSPIPLVVCSLFGVAFVVWRMLMAVR